ncbi:DUF1189 family protein [Vagococcus sp. DIV0080]|uniref:DUF1189 family protein n=1 Tax=Candidatus Vagococcus giribetii TaxID=2230876 RepID=A0ABS3HQ02_9ENTE|nr:DUF1189 family protein [Vagococcus sp. DIV0080]MBO0475810.1 DUF1189 family protein [Vagococcus sp. DIV0080]
MKEYQFPISYFVSCFSPKKIFLNRRTLAYWQMLIVSIFLIFLLLNPVALNANKTQEFNLKSVTPDLVAQMDKMDMKNISSISITDSSLDNKETQQINDLIYVNASSESFDKVATGLNFEENQLVMKDKNGLTFNLRYTDSFSPTNWQTNEDFKSWLNEEWNAQNAAYRILSVTILVSLLVLSSTIFLIFGAAFFIWLTKRSHLSSIKTYKEALNVTINALFLPTLIAMILGLIHYDITLIMTVQSLGLALQILVLFVKTKFNDSFAKTGKISLAND